ncbi:MAG: C4-dicarboxylate ABC transporter substrate-binding protein [Betaproteobacteria bacterium RIFCSPLOWO2_12_FULL_62_58]|nr:MAG: C4-dicarboxylate ABC transporter substrate-binding protein [Betaproteobacteria bacterium RIFCSPLOWO2_12_FULL_62_58]
MRQFVKLLVIAAGLLLPWSAGAQQKITLSIATGPTGGVYYPMGGGMANILPKSVPGLSATAESTAGSIANLEFLLTKKADVALSMADASWDAYKGQEKFKGRPVPVRGLMVLYPNRFHIVTLDGLGINKVTDLKGRRVSTGPPRSGTEVKSNRVLEAAGLNPDKDITRERLTVQESGNALKDRKIDAFFWSGGIPTAAVTDLAASPGVKIKFIEHDDLVEVLNKKYGPLYVKDVIPAKSYPGQDKDAHVTTIWNILVTGADTPDEVAYNIVKTMFEKKADMVRVHKESENFDFKYQTNAAIVIPFHPGAVKYFREKGLSVK